MVASHELQWHERTQHIEEEEELRRNTKMPAKIYQIGFIEFYKAIYNNVFFLPQNLF